MRRKYVDIALNRNIFILFAGIQRLSGLNLHDGVDRQAGGFPLQFIALAVAGAAFAGLATTSGVLDPLLSKKF